MKLLYQFTKVAEKVVAKLDSTAQNIKKTYHEQGLEGVTQKTSDKLDLLAKQTVEYYKEIDNINQKTYKELAPKNIEEQIAAIANITAQTTQKVATDTATKIRELANHTQLIRQTIPEPFHNQFHYYDVSLTRQQTWDAVPLDTVMVKANAIPARLPGNYIIHNNISVQIIGNKWFNFTTGEGGSGALGMIMSIENHFWKTTAKYKTTQELSEVVERQTMAIFTK